VDHARLFHTVPSGKISVLFYTCLSNHEKNKLGYEYIRACEFEISSQLLVNKWLVYNHVNKHVVNTTATN
jgi:hypothetical protein